MSIRGIALLLLLFIAQRMYTQTVNDTVMQSYPRQDTFCIDTSIVSLHLDTIIQKIITKAEKHLGTRYRYGGNTSVGFDCSGFTSYLFSAFGYDLPRSSRDQALKGLPLEKAEIKRGDLVFFKGRNPNSAVIGHVGLVVDTAENRIRFIHASRRSGITYDFVDSDYYRIRYVGAKRIFDSTYTDSLNIAFVIPEKTVEVDSCLLANDNDYMDENENDDFFETIYVVKRGDTLFAIARKHSTSVEKIKSDNNLRTDKIYPGQKLIIPQ